MKLPKQNFTPTFNITRRYLAPGDILKIEVSGVGTLENSIADETR